MSAINNEYRKGVRRLVDRYPEIAYYLLESLMDELGFDEDRKGKVVRDAITNWTEAGRS